MPTATCVRHVRVNPQGTTRSGFRGGRDVGWMRSVSTYLDVGTYVRGFVGILHAAPALTVRSEEAHAWVQPEVFCGDIRE